MPKQINMNRSIQFEGITVKYSVEGKGRPVVLLHGYLLSGEAWKPLSDLLSATFRVISVDIPGHGGSGVAGETHTMEYIAEAVRAVLNDAGEEKVTACRSFHGWVCCTGFRGKISRDVSRVCAVPLTSLCRCTGGCIKEEEGDRGQSWQVKRI